MPDRVRRPDMERLKKALESVKDDNTTTVNDIINNPEKLKKFCDVMGIDPADVVTRRR